MLREIKTKLGFDLIELDHSVRMSLIPGIQKMFDTGEIRVSSLHNFCPSPAGSPMTSIDCSKFSAASAEERERAVTQTLQSIDLAGQLSASFIVLHLGQVNMNPITERLIAMAKAGAILVSRICENENQRRKRTGENCARMPAAGEELPAPHR